MLQVDVNVSELREFAKRLPELKEGIFPLMNLDLKATATQFNDVVIKILTSWFMLLQITVNFLYTPHVIPTDHL